MSTFTEEDAGACFLEQKCGMRGADCGETRALGSHCCFVQYGLIPSQQQQGFIHHLVSYTVTDSRETG